MVMTFKKLKGLMWKWKKPSKN